MFWNLPYAPNRKNSNDALGKKIEYRLMIALGVRQVWPLTRVHVKHLHIMHWPFYYTTSTLSCLHQFYSAVLKILIRNEICNNSQTKKLEKSTKSSVTNHGYHSYHKGTCINSECNKYYDNWISNVHQHIFIYFF